MRTFVTFLIPTLLTTLLVTLLIPGFIPTPLGWPAPIAALLSTATGARAAAAQAPASQELKLEMLPPDTAASAPSDTVAQSALELPPSEASPENVAPADDPPAVAAPAAITPDVAAKAVEPPAERAPSHDAPDADSRKADVPPADVQYWPEQRSTILPVKISTEVRLSSAPTVSRADTLKASDTGPWPAVCGQVVDQAGTPVAGARIELAITETVETADANGLFCLPCPRQRVSLRISAEGHGAVDYPLLPEGRMMQVKVVLPASN